MRCWGFVPVVWLARGIARLPQRLLLALGGWLAVLSWPLMGRRRRIAAINIALCFPELSDRQRRRLVRENHRAGVTGLLELIRAWYAPPATLAGLASIEGLDRLQAMLQEGKGVLLLMGHFPHAELAVRLLLEALGRPLCAVVRRNNSPCLEAMLDDARRGTGAELLDKKNVRGMLRVLQAGKALAYSADQDFSYQNAFVPFFGVAASTLTTTPEMVRRGHAVMMPFWFHRDTDGRYRLSIEEAWPGWIDGTPEQAAAIYMRELEAVVRRHPEQYLWVHRRFKTRPAGSPPLY